MRLSLLCLAACVPLAVCAQVNYPLQEDVSSLDGIIKAYYEVVSGPEGPKQTERDLSIHHPSANVMVSGVDTEGKRFLNAMTLKQFHSTMPQGAFYEKEIHRITETFGNITHVWSTYEFSNNPEGPAQGRGINSIQLYNDGNRWWILSWVYDSERSDNPIPSRYLAK